MPRPKKMIMNTFSWRTYPIKATQELVIITGTISPAKGSLSTQALFSSGQGVSRGTLAFVSSHERSTSNVFIKLGTE